ncbi:hypothetical protein IPP75_06320 [Candidatus Saccharibacteria bacterium]|nr:MAG: hypothetical protein IPP75_06320 [Candidatus Saccharibacteria bacterium]
MDATEESVKAFSELSDETWEQFVDINNRVQSHEGSWGKTQGGETDENGVIQMPYWVSDPLISEFVAFFYGNEFIVNFKWSEWDEGRDWYKNSDESKYDALDVPTTLKLLTAVIRNDRFSDGALVGAFESGEFPRLINTLVGLRGK